MHCSSLADTVWQRKHSCDSVIRQRAGPIPAPSESSEIFSLVPPHWGRGGEVGLYDPAWSICGQVCGDGLGHQPNPLVAGCSVHWRKWVGQGARAPWMLFPGASAAWGFLVSAEGGSWDAGGQEGVAKREPFFLSSEGYIGKRFLLPSRFGTPERILPISVSILSNHPPQRGRAKLTD